MEETNQRRRGEEEGEDEKKEDEERRCEMRRGRSKHEKCLLLTSASSCRSGERRDWRKTKKMTRAMKEMEVRRRKQ
eukprot:761138-Hanusia_phi.AAC.3